VGLPVHPGEGHHHHAVRAAAALCRVELHLAEEALAALFGDGAEAAVDQIRAGLVIGFRGVFARGSAVAREQRSATEGQEKAKQSDVSLHTHLLSYEWDGESVITESSKDVGKCPGSGDGRGRRARRARRREMEE